LAGLVCVAIATVVPLVVASRGNGTVSAPRAVLAGAVGALDPSFNRSGTAVVGGSNGATGVAVVPAGSAAGDLMVSGGDGNFQVGRLTRLGALDTAFGTAGIVDSFPGQANAVAVVPIGAPNAGDTVAVGYQASSKCGPQVATPVIAEYTTNGLPNTAFGVKGVVAAGVGNPPAISCPPGGGVLNSVAIGTHGNIYVAGVAFTSANSASTLVASLKPQGTALNAFYPTIASIVGDQVSGQNPTASQGNAIAISPVIPSACSPLDCLGDIVVAGFSVVNGTQYLTVSAFTNCINTTGCPGGGALDPAFGVNGSVIATNRPGSSAAAVTVLPNSSPPGNVAVAGSTGSNFLLAEYTPTGTAVSNFGSSGNGQVANNPNLKDTDGFTGLAYQLNGNFLSAVGFTGAGAGKQMAMAQYNATTGAPNASFGNGGAVTQAFGSFPSSLAGAAVQSDGKTVGAGMAPIGVNAVEGMGLIRVGGPTVTVSDHLPVNSPSNSVTVHFSAAVNEHLFNTVQAEFCASLATALVNASTQCGLVSTAGTAPIDVVVKIPVTVPIGRLETITVSAVSGHGLSPGTHATGTVVVRRV
jgi:hypothetical protein